jgi:hypothetical protein
MGVSIGHTIYVGQSSNLFLYEIPSGQVINFSGFPIEFLTSSEIKGHSEYYYAHLPFQHLI